MAANFSFHKKAELASGDASLNIRRDGASSFPVPLCSSRPPGVQKRDPENQVGMKTVFRSDLHTL